MASEHNTPPPSPDKDMSRRAFHRIVGRFGVGITATTATAR